MGGRKIWQGRTNRQNTGYIARDSWCYSGAWGCCGKPRPLHRRWGWTVAGLWRLNWLGYICRHACSASTFIWTLQLPWIAYLPGFPTHPPSPASSYHPCYFSSATTASWQPLCSPSAHHLCGGIAAGLPVSIGDYVVSPSSSMAPPSVGSTMGHHHGCGLGIAWLLLLQVPPVSFLAPPSIITTLDFVRWPPPGHPATSLTSSNQLFPSHVPSFVCLHSPPPSLPFSLWWEVAPSGRGANWHTHRSFVVFFIPHVLCVT